MIFDCEWAADSFVISDFILIELPAPCGANQSPTGSRQLVAKNNSKKSTVETAANPLSKTPNGITQMPE